MDQLKFAKVLNGYRGRPAVDKAAIVQAVMAVQRFVTAHQGQVAEVEINPLMCTPDAAIAADALIKMERTQ